MTISCYNETFSGFIKIGVSFLVINFILFMSYSELLYPFENICFGFFYKENS